MPSPVRAPPSSALPDFVSPVAVGDLFIEFAPMLKLYAQFASNNEASSRLVAQLREDNEEFAEFADAASNDARCKGQSIESFLIMPIQRIPRYSLLLAELRKHTPEAHADFALLPKAEEVVAMVGKNINEAVRARYWICWFKPGPVACTCTCH
jgi:hypothetical protein